MPVAASIAPERTLTPRTSGSVVGRRRVARTIGIVASILVVIVISACADSAGTPVAPGGLNRTKVDALVRDITNGKYGEIRSFLITSGNDAAMEFYFRGGSRDEVAPVYSVSKSITSLVTGIALSKGAISGVSVPLRSVLKTRATQLDADTLRARITLQSLLAMRAGITWNENAAPYATPQNPVTQMLASSDWLSYVLTQPMSSAPDVSFSYNTGATVLLGAAVGEAVGVPIDEYANTHLLGPLGIPARLWQRGPGNTVYAGGGISMRAIDLVSIGRVVRDEGRWGSTQLISAQWIKESLTPRSTASYGSRYGYQWWLLGPNGPWDAAHPVYAAIGYGGQLILIIPHTGLVAVVLSRSFDRDALVLAQELTQRIVATVD